VSREHVLTKAVVLVLAREVRNNVDKRLSAKPGTIRAIISTARSTLVNELACPLRSAPAPDERDLLQHHGGVCQAARSNRLVAQEEEGDTACGINRHMLSVCGMVGRYVVDWRSTLWIMLGAAYVTCLNTGLRKCSISTAHPDDLYAMMSNIAWFVDGDWCTEPTVEQLETIKGANTANTTFRMQY
jgi:hypothetical protein